MLTRLDRRRRGVLVVMLLATGVFAATVGALAGDRWGDALRRRLFDRSASADLRGWQVMSTTDLPRYEFLRVPLSDSALILGGFYSPAVRASRRVDMLNLMTGTWTRRRDMPVALTHATPAQIGNVVWLAGGFEGDHPGPATTRVWRYAIDRDEWTAGPPLPVAIGGGALAARADTLHFFGGYLADRDTDSPWHGTLAPGDTVWRTRAVLPSPRGHISPLTDSETVYAVSGSSNHEPRPIDVRVLQRYDAASDRWHALRSTPFSLSHTEPSTVLYQEGVLSAGGRARDIGRENNDAILWYSIPADRWRYVGRGPMAMLGGLAVTRRDTLYFGLGAAKGNDAATATIWKRALRDTWQEFDSMPRPLGEVAAGVIGDSLYLVGDGSPSLMIFDLAAGQWLPDQRLAGRPAPGNHHAAEVVGGRLYLFGGIGRASSGIVQIYDPGTRQWTFGPPMPFAAGSSASAVIGGRVYVAGGIVGERTTAEAAVFDTVAKTWRLVTPMPRARNHAASGTDGSRLYVFGGRGPGSGDANVVADGFDDVQIYDPTTDRWTVSDGSRGAPLPLPQKRGGMGKAVFLNGEFWVIGGETVSGSGATPLGTYARIDIFNPRTNRWRVGPPLQHPRHGICPLVDQGRILVAGGGMRSGFGRSNVFEVIWPK
ncbi:MAG: kelch repeat-containing protein [Gemmatimonadota bacterium]|nr:kelch repeat-containing protein [Gemmatimonadota bacterium]